MAPTHIMARSDNAVPYPASVKPYATKPGDRISTYGCTARCKPFSKNTGTVFFLVCLGSIAFDSHLASASTSLVTLRSDQSLLPESILRETEATIDRTRLMLAQRREDNGLWFLTNGTETVFPVLALCDTPPGLYAAVVSESRSCASGRIEGILTKPWTAHDAAEASYTALAGLLSLESTDNERLLNRLERTQLTEMNLEDAALLLMTLEAYGRPTESRWPGLLNSLYIQTRQTPESVAIAALGRLKSGRKEGGPPPKDVLAHVRWIARQINLGYGKDVPVPDPITPKAAFYIAVLASQLPRQTLIGDPSMLPYDWRNQLAGRLIAQQRTDAATGLNYWDSSHEPSPFSDAALRDTTYAIMTLLILSE